MACSRSVAYAETEYRDAELNAQLLLEAGGMIVDQVKDYAREADREWFTVQTPPPRHDDTIVDSEQLKTIIDSIPAGSLEVPQEVKEALEEAQLIGRHSTIPSPPDPLSEDTIPEEQHVRKRD